MNLITDNVRRDAGEILFDGTDVLKLGKRFRAVLGYILNKALNHRMVDPNTIFIDGTHIKASANKKKYQKEQVAKAAKVYSGQLRREVNEENVVRMKKGKRYTPHISGRSIWIWLNRYAKRNVRRRFMRSAKKPLNGSLRMRRRNTR